jgi:hypothetical protein
VFPVNWPLQCRSTKVISQVQRTGILIGCKSGNFLKAASQRNIINLASYPTQSPAFPFNIPVRCTLKTSTTNFSFQYCATLWLVFTLLFGLCNAAQQK